jgi:Na+/phosphate symporter
MNFGTLIVPLVMAIAGALAYALSANPKVAELGRLLFAAGVFAIGFALAGSRLTL